MKGHLSNPLALIVLLIPRSVYHTSGSVPEEMERTHGRVFPTASLLPLVGLGTWTQRKLGEVKDAVLTAIR